MGREQKEWKRREVALTKFRTKKAGDRKRWARGTDKDSLEARARKVWGNAHRGVKIKSSKVHRDF